MFRSLSLFRSVSRPVSNSIYARGRRKLRTTCKFNTHVNISSLFITFQVRPQGTRRKEGRQAAGRRRRRRRQLCLAALGHFPWGILAKRGIFLANEPRTPSVTSKVCPAAADRHRQQRQQSARGARAAGLHAQVWNQSLPSFANDSADGPAPTRARPASPVTHVVASSAPYSSWRASLRIRSAVFAACVGVRDEERASPV